MENLEKLYLLFCTDGLYYLLPVSKTERILDGRQIPADLTVADMSKLTGGRGYSGESGGQYMILLNEEEGGFGLLVENIAGMQEVEEEELVPLPELVLGSSNGYLKAAVKLKSGQAVWAYVLEPGLLDVSGEPRISNSSRLRKAGAGTMSGGTYIRLEYGGRQLYVKQEKVAAVVSRPLIQRVPGAAEDVLGIAEYEAEVAVYYNPAENTDAGEPGTGAREYACGVLLERGPDIYMGIPCDTVGTSEEFMEDLVPVINGVGEKCCD